MNGIITKKTAFLLLSALLLGMLCGCGESEKTKTIILPDKSGNLSSEAINIRNIQEYSYEGNPTEGGNITLNERGNLCLIVPLEKVGYEFQEITLSDKQVVHRIPIKGTSIANIQLAPGGRYVSYEVIEKETQQLIALETEEERSIVLHHWKDLNQLYMYQWSGDGSILFSWEDGLNYAQDSVNWHIHQYHLESNFLESESETLVEGSGNASRQVLPNYDGSQVFVRERYVNGGEANWLFWPNKEDNDYPLYTPSEINWAVKFSQNGLYMADVEGNLCLVTNLLGKPEEKTLIPFNNMALEVCEKGDHIFLIEKDSSGKAQLSGIFRESGVVEEQVLYKNIDADASNIAISQDDTKVVMQNCKYLEDDRCLFTVTVLEY